MFIKEKKMLLYFVSIIYVLLLSFIYQNYISPFFNGNISSFGMYGYPKGDFSAIKIIFILVFLFLLIPLLPSTILKPSDLIIIFHYYFLVLPFFSLYIISLTSSNDVMYIDFLMIYIFFSLLKLFLRYKSKSKFKLFSTKYAKYIVLLTSVLIAIYLYLVFGTRSLVTSLLDVYDQRDIFNNAGFFINYLVSFFSFGLLTYLIYEYNKSKSYLLIIILFLFYFIVFLTTGSKLVFLSFTLIMILSYKYNGSYNNVHIGLYLLLLLILSILLVEIFDNFLVMSLFVRRTFILPAQIFNLNFQYFTINDYNYMSAYTHNFLNTSYVDSVSHIIGDTYFNDGVHANTGIISDAYSNFGIIGIFMYTFIFISLFRFINSLNEEFNYQLTPLFGGIAVSLTNSGLLAVIVYQIIPMLLVFFLVKYFRRLN